MSIDDLKIQNAGIYEQEKYSQEGICRSMPIELTISDTNLCNLNCVMCHKNSRKSANPLFLQAKKNKLLGRAINDLNNVKKLCLGESTMNFGLFEKLAKEVFPYSQYIYFSVCGEPFLNKNFYRQLDLVSKFQVRLQLFTNGTLIPSDAKLKIILPHLAELIVSFDGASKNTYEKIRRFSNFEVVLANIKRLNKLRQQLNPNIRTLLVLKMVLMRSNIEELSDWVQLAKDLLVDRIAVSHVMIFDKELLQESLFFHKELTDYHLKKAKNLALKLQLQIGEFPPLFSEYISNDLLGLNNPCDFLRKWAFIELDGRVLPCCSSIKEGLEMGNIKEQSFKEIWNGSRYQKLRRSFFENKMLPQCRSCFHRLKLDRPLEKEAYILCGY